MRNGRAAIAVGLLGSGLLAGGSPTRFVQGRTLVSETFPAIRIRVAVSLRYVGRVPFTLGETAAGERFVFVEAESKRVCRLFIAHFEGFLPGNDSTYRYDLDDATVYGGLRFKENSFAFSNAKEAGEQPEGEAARTARFLTESGYTFDDVWLAHRFVTLADSERRHELILFYVEMAGSSGMTMDRLYANDEPTEAWRAMKPELRSRALAAFEILQ